jgi:diacyltrehalose acyltransferase
LTKLLAGAIAAAVLSSAGVLGTGVAAADETTYQVGGAKVPNIPWYDYTYRAGGGYYPGARRVLVDYSAGLIPGWLLSGVPGARPDSPAVGESVVEGQNNLDAAIRSNTNGPGVAIGLSEGALVLGAEQARLANDPTAPPPDQLSFTSFGDPAGRHSFGQSFLTTLFPSGTFLPVIDYTVPAPVESQYNTTRVVAAYDGLGDFPDRPNPLAVLNSLMGAAIVHTPTAFTTPSIVPPKNIVTTTNSRGATVTTYFVPNRGIPLTLPFRYLGVPADVMDQVDGALQPIIDAGYSRNDNPSSAPITVEAGGLDPLDAFDAKTRADIEGFLQQLRNPTAANIDGLVQQVRNLYPTGPGY